MTDYIGGITGLMPIIKPYVAPTYRSETKPAKPRAVKCGACGSTAKDHTDKQCAKNQLSNQSTTKE